MTKTSREFDICSSWRWKLHKVFIPILVVNSVAGVTLVRPVWPWRAPELRLGLTERGTNLGTTVVVTLVSNWGPSGDLHLEIWLHPIYHKKYLDFLLFVLFNYIPKDCTKAQELLMANVLPMCKWTSFWWRCIENKKNI